MVKANHGMQYIKGPLLCTEERGGGIVTSQGESQPARWVSTKKKKRKELEVTKMVRKERISKTKQRV